MYFTHQRTKRADNAANTLGARAESICRQREISRHFTFIPRFYRHLDLHQFRNAVSSLMLSNISRSESALEAQRDRSAEFSLVQDEFLVLDHRVQLLLIETEVCARCAPPSQEYIPSNTRFSPGFGIHSGARLGRSFLERQCTSLSLGMEIPSAFARFE